MIYGKASILSPSVVDTGVRGALLDKWALLDLIFQFRKLKYYLFARAGENSSFINKRLLNLVEYANKLVGVILKLFLI